jgi:TetR/AcrR family transcriptional repressor of bet genes
MERAPNVERRAQIVAALARVMAARGYERATVAQIAAEAGLAAGLVHYHFASKRDVLLTLVADLAAVADARASARVAHASGPHDELDALLGALLERGEGEDLEAVRCWALIGAEAVKDAEVAVIYAELVGALAGRVEALLVRVLRAEGRSTRGRRAMAAALVAAVEGTFALAAAAPAVVPRGSAAAMVRRMARGLVASQPPARGRS